MVLKRSKGGKEVLTNVKLCLCQKDITRKIVSVLYPVGAEVSLREQSINKVMELGAYKLKLRSGHFLSLYMLCVLDTERISLHAISSKELRT